VRSLPNNVQLALKGQLIRQVCGTLDEHLLHEGLAGLGGFPQGRIVGGHIPPAQDRLAFFLNDAFENAAALSSLGRVGGGKEHAHAVVARLGQGNALCCGHLVHKLMGQLQQNARSIPRIGLGTDRAPVGQVQQNRQPLLHNGVGLRSFHMDNEADTAGIVLELRVVEPLLLGRMV
jgi:hypothetical protein